MPGALLDAGTQSLFPASGEFTVKSRRPAGSRVKPPGVSQPATDVWRGSKEGGQGRLRCVLGDRKKELPGGRGGHAASGID